MNTVAATTLVQLFPAPPPPTDRGAPPTVSIRRVLRDGLPEMYRGSGATMAFLQGLEELVDPLGAMLDSLPAHFHYDHAPAQMLSALAAWLGVDEVESQRSERRRETLLRAGEMMRLRGTRAGLELVLSLFFPQVPLRVEDRGSVIVSAEAGPAPPGPAPAFDVFCDATISEDRQLALAQCIERWKPAGSRYRLKLKRS
jgi:phage tail-like protein